MRFDMDYLRYEITKISGREYFCHLQGGEMTKKHFLPEIFVIPYIK